MTHVAVVTTSRADYSIYRPILQRIRDSKKLRLSVIASGMHLSPDFGLTVERIEEDGFEVAERVDLLVASDTPVAIAKSMGLGTIGYAQALARIAPDILLVLGDRFEMHAAVVANVPFNVPVAHLHGGEITEGAFDDALRHSITKMSHLHFVATAEYGRRLVQMGEEPWRVHVTGAPALDNLAQLPLLDRTQFEAKYGLRLPPKFLLSTFHPETLDVEHVPAQARALLEAFDALGLPVLMTRANADTRGRAINRVLGEHARERDDFQLVDALGTQGYFSAMALASAVVGNSSSGIIEAASFQTPVVNIGGRQRGRLRPDNVVDVEAEKSAIVDAVRRVTSDAFRRELAGLENPYGDGKASERIVHLLETVELDRLLRKRFVQLSSEEIETAIKSPFEPAIRETS